ncbi:MAG: hypothetical protein WDA00_04170 [Eubacteriales bacterium]
MESTKKIINVFLIIVMVALSIPLAVIAKEDLPQDGGALGDL